MPNKIFSLTIILISSFIHSQEIESHHKKMKFKTFDEAELFMRNGETLNGYCRILANNRILFTKHENSTRQIFDYKKVEILRFISVSNTTEYHYKIVEGKQYGGGIKLLELAISGKVNLFTEYVGGTSYGPSMGGGYGFSSFSKTNHYINREGEDKVVNLRIGNTYSKRFKNIAKRYFSDCKDLLDKINSKGFKRYDVVPVVKYYNNQCN